MPDRRAERHPSGATPSLTRDGPASFHFNALKTEGDISRQALGSLTPYPKPKQATGFIQLEQPDGTFCGNQFELRK